MVKSKGKEKRGRGRPPVEVVQVLVRLRLDEIAALDQWISAQGLPITRPMAIRALVRQGTGMERGKKR